MQKFKNFILQNNKIDHNIFKVHSFCLDIILTRVIKKVIQK